MKLFLGGMILTVKINKPERKFWFLIGHDAATTLLSHFNCFNSLI